MYTHTKHPVLLCMYQVLLRRQKVCTFVYLQGGTYWKVSIYTVYYALFTYHVMMAKEGIVVCFSNEKRNRKDRQTDSHCPASSLSSYPTVSTSPPLISVCPTSMVSLDAHLPAIARWAHRHQDSQISKSPDTAGKQVQLKFPLEVADQ
jgi:hypothetical protein